MTTTKICGECFEEKPLDQFPIRNKSTGQLEYRCKTCVAAYNKEYRRKNKEKLALKAQDYYQENKPTILKNSKDYYDNNKEAKLEYQKAYQEENKEQVSEYKKEWYQTNKEEILEGRKEYYENNREQVNERRRQYMQKRMFIDPAFKLRVSVSSKVREGLKRQNISKNGQSTWQNLPYTPQELKTHLENQFESWMTWENWGVYDPKTWNDNDPTTWKWQIDHIIPHSEFSYTSLQDDAFRQCWSLSNLRPYSAKQNCIDGTNRSRHIKI